VTEKSKRNAIFLHLTTSLTSYKMVPVSGLILYLYVPMYFKLAMSGPSRTVTKSSS